MLASDALLLKLLEEASEVSTETSTIVQLASKAIRFGDESFHPREPERGTNGERLLAHLDKFDVEMHDLHTAAFAHLCAHWQFSTMEESILAAKKQQWFPTQTLCDEAIRKLRKFDRLLGVTVEKGSLSAEEHDKLQHLLGNVMEYLSVKVVS